MDPTTGVAGAAIVIAVTECIQQALQFPNRWAPPVALLVGIAVSVGGFLSAAPGAPTGWYPAILAGIMLGVAAVATHTAWQTAQGVATAGNNAAVDDILAQVADFMRALTPPPPTAPGPNATVDPYANSTEAAAAPHDAVPINRP